MPETEEERRRREAELEALMQRALGDRLTRAPAPPIPDRIAPRDTSYMPGGEYRFTRSNRAADAAAVAPYGEVPPPTDAAGNVISDEEADDWQDELDLSALYDLNDRERREEAARQEAAEAELLRPTPPVIDVTPAPKGDTYDQHAAKVAQQAQAAAPPAAQVSPPPPAASVTDRFLSALNVLRQQKGMPPIPAAAATEANLSPATSRGAEADLYGHDTEGGFSRDKAIAAGEAAYDRETARRDPVNQYDRGNADRQFIDGDEDFAELRGDSQLGLREMRGGPDARTPEQIAELESKGLMTTASRAPVRSSVTPDKLPNPYGESDTRWEDEFLQNNTRMSNDEIRKRARVIGIFHGLDAQKAFVDREMKMAEGYERGLVESRGRDYGDRRVGRADAVAIAGTGNVDPESAASLTNRDMLMSAYPNGMYSQGLSAERSEKMLQQFLTGELGRDYRQGREIEADRHRTDTNAAVELAKADAWQQRALAQQKERLTHDEHANLFGATAQGVLGLPMEVGVAAFDGDYSKVPPERMAEVESLLARIKPFNLKSAMQPLGPGITAFAAKIPYNAAKVEAEVIARARADPKYATDMQTDMMNAGMSLKQGIEAWNHLSEQGKRDFAQFGGKGIGAVLANGLKDERDRALGGAVWTVLNNLIQERSGVAVTESEWGRTANEIGLGQGIWDPFNTYEGIEHYLNNAGERMRARFDIYQRNIGWK